MAVTLKEVAQHAQISVPAASLILNGKGDIYSKDTNERVQEAARTLGYRPNLAARAARSGKFNAVGLLMSDHPAYSRLSVKLLQSVMAKLSDKEMHLTMSQMTDAQFTDSKYLPRMLRQHMVDGMLINYTHHFPEHLSDFIHQLKLPAIWMNARLDHDSVYPDEDHSGRLAAEYLLKLGHRKIQYLEFEGSVHYSRTDRRNGYSQAMIDAGLTPVHVTLPTQFPDQVDLDPMSCDTLTHVMNWLKANREQITAVQTHSPWEARVLLYAAAKCGIDVPSELSVVTNGNESFNFMGIAMSSTVLPLTDMGQVAVEMLMKKIAAPKKRIKSKVLESTMVPAQTTLAI
ncbi:MAG: LacI family DNA-binding transcriptional regulator [Phycisphaeraceae bacterium JB051]